MSCWSESDNYFVGTASKGFKVYFVDLSLEPLQMEEDGKVTYDGPKGADFQSLLLDNGFQVNRQGRAIVCFLKRNSDDKEYKVFLVENVIQLSKYDFTKIVPVPQTTQAVNVLKSFLEVTRADLAKKNAEMVEFQRNSNSVQARPITDSITEATKVFIRDAITDSMKVYLRDAITEAMKKVFTGVATHLQPPSAPASTGGVNQFTSAAGSVLQYLLGSPSVDREFGGATFFGAADEILKSIVGMFNERNGLNINIGMVSSRTPADVIRNLNSLKNFMESRFFIDGTVMVKYYGLMNERDIPVVFRDAEVGVAELHRKDVGPKSIININGESIFYGYFNIPSFGKFKGILTRSDVLPNEIMEKLRHSSYQLDDKGFWFVQANGEALFDGSSTGVDFLGFLLRMNKTFVNNAGRYLKFQFTAAKFPGSPHVHDDKILYYRDSCKVSDTITRVQYDMNETPALFSEGRVSLLETVKTGGFDWRGGGPWITEYLDRECAFVFKDSCFIGKVTDVTATATDQGFRQNALVTAFFKRSMFGNYCFVDALATTYFVFNPGHQEYWVADQTPVVPRIN